MVTCHMRPRPNHARVANHRGADRIPVDQARRDTRRGTVRRMSRAVAIIAAGAAAGARTGGLQGDPRHDVVGRDDGDLVAGHVLDERPRRRTAQPRRARPRRLPRRDDGTTTTPRTAPTSTTKSATVVSGGTGTLTMSTRTDRRSSSPVMARARRSRRSAPCAPSAPPRSSPSPNRAAADRAERILRDELVAIDRACSRFRTDSELSAAAPGARCRASRSAPCSSTPSTVACDVARRTGGAVDPTVGAGHGVARVRPRLRRARLARGTELLERAPPGPGLVAHRARRAVAERCGCPPARTSTSAPRPRPSSPTAPCGGSPHAAAHRGVLVSIGGDVAMAGERPRRRLGRRHRARLLVGHVDDVDQVVADRAKAASPRRARRCAPGSAAGVGCTTSSTPPPANALAPTGRSCRPRARPASTPTPRAPPPSSGVSAPCAELQTLGPPARLVRHDGRVVTVNGWPSDSTA